MNKKIIWGIVIVVIIIAGVIVYDQSARRADCCNGEQYKDSSAFIGYFTTYEKNYISDIDGEKVERTCDAFTVSTGDENLIKPYVNRVDEGNTVNYKDKDGNLVINLDVTSLTSEELVALKNSTKNSPISITVQEKMDSPSGTSNPCYSHFNISKVGDISPTPAVKTETTKPVSTTGWKTYTNEKFGFSFKYPANWTPKVTRSDSEGSYSIISFINEKNQHVLGLNNPIREIGHEWAEKVGESQIIKIEGSATTINKTFFIDRESPDLIYAYLQWNYDNWQKSGEIWFNYRKGDKQQEEVLNQILSTFKFTSPTPAVKIETVKPVLTTSAIKVISPNNGDLYKVGDKIKITWKDQKDAANYTIALVSKNTSKGIVLIRNDVFMRSSGIDGTTSNEWIVSGVDPGTYFVEVYEASARELTGRSGEFTITN